MGKRKTPKYFVKGTCVVGKGGGVVYEGELCRFSREQLEGIAWLMNHGHGNDDWFTLEPHLEAYLASQKTP